MRVPSIVVATVLPIMMAAPAAAQSRTLRESTHPIWASFGIGPQINMSNSANVDPGYAALHLNQQLGFHLDGSGDGPAIALDVHQAWASASYLGGAVGWNGFLFEAGARFVYDIQPVPGLGFYLSPSAGLNFALLDRSTSVLGARGSVTETGIAPQFGFDVKLVLVDRVLLYVRPFGLDIPILFARDNTVVFVNYDLQIGAGVTF